MTRPDPHDDLTALDRALAGEPVGAEHADLLRLVAAVRADAPRMSPELALRLEEIVAEEPARAPRARRSWPAWLTGPSRLAMAGALASVLLGLIVVASVVRSGGGSGESLSSSSGSSSSAPAPAPVYTTRGSVRPFARESAAPATADPGPTVRELSSRQPLTDAAQAVYPRARKVERITALTLAAPPDELSSLADRVITTADRFDAVVERSNVALDDSRAGNSASFSLRVPSARLSDALAALSKLAHVRSRTESSLDITASTNTVADKLADARALRSSLLKQLGAATTPNATASLRARLRIARARIASLDARAKRLAVRSDYAKVTVTLEPTRHKADGGTGGGGGPWTPRDAWRDARSILAVAAAAAVLVAALAAPLALLAALALVARRRRREGALGRLV